MSVLNVTSVISTRKMCRKSQVQRSKVENSNQTYRKYKDTVVLE